MHAWSGVLLSDLLYALKEFQVPSSQFFHMRPLNCLSKPGSRQRQLVYSSCYSETCIVILKSMALVKEGNQALGSDKGKGDCYYYPISSFVSFQFLQ